MAGLNFKGCQTSRHLLLLVATLSLGACSRGAFVAHLSGGESKDSLSGRWLITPGASLADTGSCRPSAVALYAAGSRVGIDQPLLTAPLEADGSFAFHGLSNLDQALSADGSAVVAASGCDKFWARIVTGYTGQDVTAGSTLVAYAPALTSVASGGANPAGLAALMAALDRAPTSSAAYDQLAGDAAMREGFQTIFGFAPERLIEAPPKIVSLKISSSADERQAAAFAAAATHWSPSYKVAYLWKDGNTPVSSSGNATYTPSANAQGTHAIALYVGKAQADGDALDTASPYVTWSGSLEVADTLPAEAPALSINGGLVLGATRYTTSRDLSLALATGEALSHCESFSALALTENVETAPLDPAAYKLRCTQNGLQTFSYTLTSAGDGVKTLRLWAIDASGKISRTASVQSVTLDTAAPSLTAVALANEAADGYLNLNEKAQPHALISAVSGAGFDVAAYRLVPAAVTCDAALSYDAAVPQNNAADFGADGPYKVCIQLTDWAGHAPAYGESPVLTLKTTAPVFTSVDLAGGSTDGYLNAAERISATPLVANLVAAGAAQVGYAVAPVAAACTASLTYAAVIPTSTSAAFGSDGDYKVCVQLTDAAGNQSFGQSATVHLKTALPASFTVTAPSRYTAASTPAVTWSAAAGAATYDLNIGATAACSSPVQTYSALAATTQALTALADGDYYACVTAKDVAGNQRGASAYLFTVDTAAPGAFSLVAPASLTANPAPTLSWGAASGAASYDLVVAGASDCSSVTATYAGLTATSRTLTALADGTYYVCLTAKDQAGNVTTATNSGSTSFTVDQTAPTLTLTSHTGGQKVKGSASTAVTWTATDAHIGTGSIKIELSSDSGATWATLASGEDNDGTYPWNVAVPEGTTYRLRITATDQAGNATTATSSADFLVDTTVPAISSFVLASGAVSVALPTVGVALAATDNLSSVVQMRLSETAAFADSGWVPYAANSNFSLSQVNGTKTVYVWVKDGAGNVSLSTSATLDLDFGTPPSVTVVTPDGSTPYNPGDTVGISWTCQSSSGLAAAPIATIEYTTDDGATFTTIATGLTNNDSATSGSYPWTLPASLAGTPFRLIISCKSAAGVVTAAYSKFIDTPGWSVFMGDPWRDIKDVAASIARVGGPIFSNNGITADSDNNIFYVKGQGIMRIDGKTALVTTYAGDINTAGCTMATGQPAATTLLYNPLIVGTDAAQSSLFVLSTSCGKLFKIRVSDGQVTEWYTFSTDGIAPYLTKSRILVYADVHTNRIYKLDINTQGNTPVVVMGNGTCITGALTEGVAAASSPMRARPLDAGNCYVGGAAIIANDDVSKVWINNYDVANAYRIDLVAGTYVVAQADAGWNLSPLHCVAAEFDSKVYCSSHGGLWIDGFNTTTGAWDPVATYLPFPNNDSSGTARIGSMSDKLLVHYSLNVIYTVTPTPSAPWPSTIIAGQPMSTMGNGGPPSGVGFDLPLDIKYNAATQKLYIRNSGGHMRVVDFTTSPYATSSLFNGSNYAGIISTAVNRAGDALALMDANCSLYFANFSVTATTMTDSPWFVAAPCGFTAPYPPATGASIAAGEAVFPYGVMPYNETPAYHSNGSLYFGAFNGSSDAFVFSSDKSVINRVAGRVGAVGYDPADEGQTAAGALLTNPQQLQEDANGDLLVWDGPRLRKITITTDATPKISTLVDYTTIAGYTGAGNWGDAVYDESTGYTYYVSGSQVHKAKAGVGDTAYDFTGTTLAGGIRIALTPAGLLVLQPSKSRILRVAP